MEQLLILALILACPLMITHAPFMRFARTNGSLSTSDSASSTEPASKVISPAPRSAVGPPT